MKRLPNLLSREQQRVYRRYLIGIYLRRLLYMQIFTAVLVAAVLGAQYWYYHEKLSDLESVLSNFSRLQTQIKIEELQTTATNHNNRLKAASAILTARSDLSFYLNEFAKLIPEGVTLDFVELKTEGSSTLDIQGRAAVRDQIVVFQNRMEQSPYFTITYAPLSNLTKPTDVPFRFILTLKKAKQ